ncbi:hypothetical protein XENOCAPTIV_017223, partial [Xenoophorus captivus]
LKENQSCSSMLPEGLEGSLSVLQGYMQPQLLGNEFTHLEFPRRVQRKEVGKRMLYRDFTMNGCFMLKIILKTRKTIVMTGWSRRGGRIADAGSSDFPA